MKYRFRRTVTAACLAAAFFMASQQIGVQAASGGVGVMSEEESGEEQEGTQETGEIPETEGIQETGETQTAEGAQETEGMQGAEAAESWPEGPSIVGEAGIVMEASTGTILYAKNIHAQYYPASITKILTALLVIENCEMDEIVTIPHDAVYMEDKGSHIALDEGEELTVEDCLYGMLLASANDAAYALAEHVAGSIEAFADMMNARAAELGCQDSHFVNPHGLPNEQHLTSAYDMALITKEALKYDIFRKISETTFYEIQPSEKQPDLIPMSNHHKMLLNGQYHYEGVFAGKTGYTVAAKNTLVTCAGRDGMELICVTMKTEGRQVYVDTAALFDFGFENFKKLDIASNTPQSVEAAVHARTAGEETGSVQEEAVAVQVSEDGYVVVPSDVSFDQLTQDLYYDTENAKEGETALMVYHYGEHEVGQALIALPETLVVPEETEAEPETIAEPVPEEKGTFTFHWWYVLIILLLLAGIACGIFFFVRRQIWKHRWRTRSGRGNEDLIYRDHPRRNRVYRIQARKRRRRR